MARNRSAEYWTERLNILENSNDREAKRLFADLERSANIAQGDISRQIRDFYRRFARNNDLTMAEARKLLNSQELEEFKWGVNGYIERGQSNDPVWAKQLENASIKVRVQRLEALQINIQESLERMFENQSTAVDEHMRSKLLKNYYRNIFEVQKGTETAWKVPAIDERKLNNVMKQPWATDDRSFSERIWGNRDKLVKELSNQLTQDFVAGRPVEHSIREIQNKFNTTKHNAKSLVLTESAFFSSVGQQEAFDFLEVDRFQIIATLDTRTSEVCQEMDLQIFPQSEFQAGVTAPPFHVRCRSTTIPYFEDSTMRRWARNPDGTKETITGNISYREWRENYAKEAPE